MFCAIWYHLYNLKNVKNIYGGVLQACNFPKSNTPMGVFQGFVIAQVIPNHATHHILRLYTGGDSGPAW